MTDTVDFEVTDEHGYPTEECLAAIRHWTGTPRRLVEDVLAPVFDVYGWLRVEQVQEGGHGAARRTYVVTLITGGWSGNESAIGALDKGLFGFGYWHSSTRGGKHVYEVPVDQWDKPQVEWNFPTGYERLEEQTFERAVAAVETAREHYVASTSWAEADPAVWAYNSAIAAIRNIERREG